ncbi:MAG: 4Fe-4S binding protein [Oscillospiraceae bacterium]|jgi:ferredoxin|nr:4Fe-4S binding protein [Oscillospiraceae bacterium]
MVRKIIHIDEGKCNGCGLCAEACNEGAIGIVAGKARLTREDYCDGLGNCLPACPTGAISFEEREAPAYDEAAVQRNAASESDRKVRKPESALKQWPVQLKLAPVNAPHYDGAELLVAADCAAYAYGNFHDDFMRGRVTLIGCPKLDRVDYSEKLTAIFAGNNIKSVTVARMEVPCCGGIEHAVKTAIDNSGKFIPWRVVTLSTDGAILED